MPAFGTCLPPEIPDSIKKREQVPLSPHKLPYSVLRDTLTERTVCFMARPQPLSGTPLRREDLCFVFDLLLTHVTTRLRNYSTLLLR